MRELIAAGARALFWRARVEGRASLSPAEMVHLVSWYQVLRESGSHPIAETVLARCFVR